MFNFNLPRLALLNVAVPGGGMQTLVHLGDGKFASNLPPLAFSGLVVDVRETDAVQPVTWDSSVLPLNAEMSVFVYDAAHTMKVVEEAAAGGDLAAAGMLLKMRQTNTAMDAA